MNHEAAMPSFYDLLHRFIIGAVAACLVLAAAWVALGVSPSCWVVMLGADALLAAGSIFITVRRARERRRLQADYDRPAFGEEWRP